MTSSDTLSDFTTDTASQLHRSALRLFRMLRAAHPGKGLSLAKFTVLGRLYQDGVTTASGMAAYLRIQPQSVTRLLADLERQHLIVRCPNKADRRQSLIEITEAGTQLLLEEVRAQQLKLAKIIAESLTPTEQEMLRLAAGLIDRLAVATGMTLAMGETGKDGDSPATRATRK
jgi:DNA-binding MarR family transcriptional regulator